MTYSKKQIEQYSRDTGFIKHYVEKVVRLLDVLNFLFSESTFKDKLVLKGDTAINLVHTNLKRLSVDIDLDYCGSIDKDATLSDRVELEKELDKYMLKENYIVSQNSRSSFALFSRIYKFKNAFENDDTIKVDINFMDRVHLYPSVMSTVTYFNKTVTIKTPSIEELFGMKINALIDRSKPRDLYDTYYLCNNICLFNKEALRKAVVFYLSLNSRFAIDDSSFNSIRAITWNNIKRELLPVLKKGEEFELQDTIDKVISLLSDLLILNKDEEKYLYSFSKGEYNPFLLFDKTIASRVEHHPMARWIEQNIRK